MADPWAIPRTNRAAVLLNRPKIDRAALPKRLGIICTRLAARHLGSMLASCGPPTKKVRIAGQPIVSPCSMSFLRLMHPRPKTYRNIHASVDNAGDKVVITLP